MAETSGPGGEAPGLFFNPGQSFGPRYTIVEEVGAGGMGIVYKALDRELRKTVALKLVPPDISRQSGAIERFRRELVLAQQVTHPNVCRVHDLGDVEGVYFISMEYIDGQTLRDWIQAVGSLSPRQTVGLARQICAGLSAIHERKITHRDLKPGNIMVDRSGHAVVMDFGLAYHPQSDKITAQGEVLGTLAYIAPEQAKTAEVDQRADIYSLGLVLFEMLTGRRAPGDGGRLPLALRDPGETCPPPSTFVHEVPALLDEAVLKCLEREPGKRFQSLTELDQALARAADELTTVAATSPRSVVLRKPLPWRAIAVACGLLLAIVLTVLLWPRPPTLSLAPWTYEGPDAHSNLAELFPVVLAEQIRAGGAVRVEPRDAAWRLEADLKVKREAFEVFLTIRSNQGGILEGPVRYHGEVKNIMGPGSRMASRIEKALGAESTRSKESLDRYLEGKKFLEGWDVEKNYGRAEEAFTAAVAADEGFAEAHAGLSRALWTHYSATREPGLVERAMREAERAVALDPSSPEAYLSLGVVQLGRGLSAEGKASFEKATQLAPADDAVCLRIATTYEALGRDDEAAAMYERAIALRPEFWENYNRAGIFYMNRSRWAEAEKHFNDVIRLRSESDTAYINLAVVYLMSGRLDDAEPPLKKALAIRASAPAHSNLGIVYYGTARFEEAAREFGEATRALPNHPTPWGNLGDALRQLGRRSEAREAYGKAIALTEARLKVKPTDASARGLLAGYLAGLGRCAESKLQTEQAARDAASSAWVRYLAAVAYAICGERESAVEEAVRAVEGGVIVDVRTSPDLKPLLETPRLRAALGTKR